jgi:hypothetical protein
MQEIGVFHARRISNERVPVGRAGLAALGIEHARYLYHGEQQILQTAPRNWSKRVGKTARFPRTGRRKIECLQVTFPLNGDAGNLCALLFHLVSVIQHTSKGHTRSEGNLVPSPRPVARASGTAGPKR